MIKRAEGVYINTYKRFPVMIEKGEGVHIFDTEGKKYLDFTAGIAVNAIGYQDEEYKNALKDQIDKIIHCSNLYYHTPGIEAAELLTKISGLPKVFFTNSGTEAIEGAIKLARKYKFDKDKSSDNEIISMKQSFHGRSLGALSVTGQTKYQDAFKPLFPGVVYAEYNNIADVKSKITEKTCAIILEPIQGEGGIYPADKLFLLELRKVCDEKDIILIFDEIQCGIGRTGEMFAYEYYGVRPDVLVLAKGLGGGMPVGAFLASDKVSTTLGYGDHGTTYGGNPLACTAVKSILNIIQDRLILDNVKKVGNYLISELNKLVESYDFIIERRGIGLMQGLELSIPVAPIINKAIDKGLLIINAGTNIIRFVPPLIINEENVDEMISILTEIFEGE